MNARVSASGAAGSISRDQTVLIQTYQTPLPIWTRIWREASSRYSRLTTPQAVGLGVASLVSFGAFVGATALLSSNIRARRESRVRTAILPHQLTV